MNQRRLLDGINFESSTWHRHFSSRGRRVPLIVEHIDHNDTYNTQPPTFSSSIRANAVGACPWARASSSSVVPVTRRLL